MNSQTAIPKAMSPTSGWFPSAIPKTSAAASNQPPARLAPPRSAARQQKRSQMRSATKNVFRAWTSARTATAHASSAKANTPPAMAAAAARNPGWRSSMTCPVMSTTRPADRAMQTPDRTFIRHATSPNGIWLHSQPSMAYVGNPVGWKIDRVCGTVWASAVSQKPVDGSMVRRKIPKATTETAAAVHDSSPSA